MKLFIPPGKIYSVCAQCRIAPPQCGLFSEKTNRSPEPAQSVDGRFLFSSLLRTRSKCSNVTVILTVEFKAGGPHGKFDAQEVLGTPDVKECMRPLMESISRL